MESLRSSDPREIGGYRLAARLGAGGMGEVFLAYTADRTLIAVKVIRAEIAADSTYRERFRQEVRAAQRVGSAFTAPVVDAGPDDPLPWLATVYIPGPSLAEAIDRGTPLPEAALWWLTYGLGEALSAIHAAGIIHRDLKPGNIVLGPDRPRVVDFGIARLTDATILTRTGTALGTPAYMCPEQVEGGDIGPAGDVFSLGSVLAYAGTGQPPFRGTTPTAVLYNVVHGEPSVDLPGGAFRDLVLACLAKTSTDRPSPADLCALAADHLGTAGPAPTWEDALPAPARTMITDRVRRSLPPTVVDDSWVGSARVAASPTYPMTEPDQIVVRRPNRLLRAAITAGAVLIASVLLVGAAAAAIPVLDWWPEPSPSPTTPEPSPSESPDQASPSPEPATAYAVEPITPEEPVTSPSEEPEIPEDPTPAEPDTEEPVDEEPVDEEPVDDGDEDLDVTDTAPASGAEFTDAGVRFGYTWGVPSLITSASFEIRGMRGQPVRLCGYVFDSNGAPLRAASLTYSLGGQMAGCRFLRPDYDTAVYTDSEIYLPTSDFAISPGCHCSLNMVVALDIAGSVFARSDAIPFTP